MNISFKKGLSENLNLQKVPYSPGRIYITTDLHELFIDVKNIDGQTERLKLIDTNAIFFETEGTINIEMKDISYIYLDEKGGLDEAVLYEEEVV